MNRRVIAVAVGGMTIAAASLGTAFALPSHPTSRSGAFKFVAVETVTRNFKGHFVSSDKDVAGGHIIGTDTLQCNVASDNKSASCDVTASYKRGQIYGVFTLNLKDGSLVGQVTGGTRLYKDATGTIKGHSVGDNKEAVSITYQTP